MKINFTYLTFLCFKYSSHFSCLCCFIVSFFPVMLYSIAYCTVRFQWRSYQYFVSVIFISKLLHNAVYRKSNLSLCLLICMAWHVWAKTEKVSNGGRIRNHFVALYLFTTKIVEIFKGFFVFCGFYIYFKYIVSNCNLYTKKLD
jgi:hypothetical protein